PPVLHQPHRDRIGLFTSRTGDRPNANSFRWVPHADDIGKEIGSHATELMLLSIKVGLIHCEGVDQMFDLVVRIGSKDSKLRSHRMGWGGRYSFGDTTIDIVSPGVSKSHSRTAIQKFAEPPNFLRRQVRGLDWSSL